MIDAKQQLDYEIERADLLIAEISNYPEKLKIENPTWANVGDAKRLNELLTEIANIFDKLG